MRDYIRTFTGKIITPTHIEDTSCLICIEDVAHALSQICRFTGHVNRFYSVAEHSVRVSRRCYDRGPLRALLHDAGEAYIADIASPVKHTEAMAPYRAIERKVQSACYDWLGSPRWPEEDPEWLHAADAHLCELEGLALVSGWKTAAAISKHHRRSFAATCGWDSKTAECIFLDLYHELHARKDLR